MGGVLLASLSLPGATLAKEPPRAVVSAEDGLLVTRFLFPEGRITLRLPANLAQGDTVSGSLDVEAIGTNVKKRARNALRLAEMGLVVGGVRGRVEISEIGPLGICGAAGGGSAIAVKCHRGGLGGAPELPVHIEDAKGRRLAEARVPVSAAAEPAGTGFSYSPVGVAGQPLEIHGTFDGRFGTTRATVGGTRARFLAESPRGLVIESPQSAVGATRLRLTEGSTSLGGALLNLAAYLEVSKPLLRADERTIIKVQIQGLQGLVEPLPLELLSRPPGITRFEGGLKEHLRIHPTEILAGGVYSWIGTLIGVQPALFRIVVLPGEEIRPRQLEPQR